MLLFEKTIHTCPICLTRTEWVLINYAVKINTYECKKGVEKMLKHGIQKCRCCKHYINESMGCNKCEFEWSAEYPPVNDEKWDLLDLNDDVEWSFIQIMDRLKYKGIDCLQVINWYSDNVIVLIGCMTDYEKIATALGVHKECMVQDLDLGLSVINLFKEKHIREKKIFLS